MCHCAALEPGRMTGAWVVARRQPPPHRTAGKPSEPTIWRGVGGPAPKRGPGGAGSDHLPRTSGKWRSPRHLARSILPSRASKQLDVAEKQQHLSNSPPGFTGSASSGDAAGTPRGPPSASSGRQRSLPVPPAQTRHRGDIQVPGDWARPLRRAGHALTGGRAGSAAGQGRQPASAEPPRDDQRAQQSANTAVKHGARCRTKDPSSPSGSQPDARDRGSA